MAGVNSEDSQSKVKDLHVEGAYTNEVVKTILESAGYDKPPDDVLQYLAETITFRIKQIVQESAKFQNKSKRKQLKTADIDNALRVKNVEPVYGFSSSDFVPFRYASGGGREVYFQEEQEVDLEEIMSQNLPKIPLDIALKSHWLAVDGVQPSIPENPPPISKDIQLKDNVDPVIKSEHISEVPVDGLPQEEKTHVKDTKQKEHKLDKKKMEEFKKMKDAHKNDVQKLKPLVTHELSVEQQLYYKEITEACVGSNEVKRTDALQSLSSDPGLYQLLPHFVTFIAEGVRVNVGQHNLALLIYLLRMIKSLMENSTLYLEKYLHELVPAVITCIVNKQLCPRPDFENHWALRDFASRLMALICKHFSTTTNNIQSRVTKTLCTSLYNENAPLVTHYGAIAGLSELGLEVLKFFVLPRLKLEGDLIKQALEGNTSDKKSAEHLQALLIKHCSVAIAKTRSPPDIHAQFVTDFGYLGTAICTKVQQLRMSQGNPSRTPVTPVLLQAMSK